MNNTWNVWGGGHLLATSGLDCKTDFVDGLVLRTVEGVSIIEVKLPASGAIFIDGAPPEKCWLAGDNFHLETSNGVTRGVLPDAYHILVEGSCKAVGLSDDLQVLSRSGKTLLGVRGKFDMKWLDADCGTLIAERRKWLDNLSLPTGITAETRTALRAACSQVKTQVYSPEDKIKSLWTTPDRWPHRHMWLWDTTFHIAGLRRLEPEVAWDALEAVFNAQFDDGFIPMTISPIHPGIQYIQPPILGLGMSLVFECKNDLERLKRCFARNAKFLRWIFANRDVDNDGLVEWVTGQVKSCRCGESGMDNSPRFDAAVPLDAPDFNAFLALECELMAEFAATLNLPEEKEFWASHHQRINKLMNAKLWNEEKGFYMDYDIPAGKQAEICSSAGFLPLISGAPTPEMAAKLVAALKDPARFGTPFSVPSISKDQPQFYSKDMWRGPVWININYLIIRGLKRYGFIAEANDLQKRSCLELEKFYHKLGTFFEYYDDMGGDPDKLLRKAPVVLEEDSAFRSPLRDYGWTATLYIDMIFAGELKK